MATSPERVRAALAEVLGEAGVEQLSERQVRGRVGARLGVADMSPYRRLVQEGVQSFLDAPGGEEAAPDASTKRKAGVIPDGEDAGPSKAAKLSPQNVMDLGSRKQLSVTSFKGRPRVDVREYYEKDGKLCPGKRGISLSAELWKKVSLADANISEALLGNDDDYILQLTDDIHLYTSTYKGKLQLHIREVYEKDGEKRPGAKGIAITPEQWTLISKAKDEIDASLQAFWGTTPASLPGEQEMASCSLPAAIPSSGGEGASGTLPLHLSNLRMADVSEYGGNTYVNIREFYEKDGTKLPGKKGIALPPQQFDALEAAAQAISAALGAEDIDFTVKLSERRKVTISKFSGRALVDIREYYSANGQDKPGKKGISLTSEQWKVLYGGMHILRSAVASHAA